jgi:hypothetical protein
MKNTIFFFQKKEKENIGWRYFHDDGAKILSK